MRRPINRAGAVLFLVGMLSGFSSGAQLPGVAEGERYMLQTRVVNGDTGEPAAGVEVSWLGSRGAEQCIVTDADGQLVMPLDYPFGWATLLYGRQGEMVTQALFLMGEASLGTELVLGYPASLMGTIQREDGKPLEGGTVTLKADPRCEEAHFEARTDGNGRFIFEDLPPGTYYVRVRHGEYFAPKAGSPSPPIRVDLVSGEVSHRDFILQEKAHGVGRVFAPDGTGAAGVEFSVPGDSEYRSRMTVTTDETGNFKADFIPVERTGSTVNIASKTLGSGSFQIPPTKPGDIVKDIVVQLYGVARVRGTVRGPNGEPVVGARVGGAKTDNSGHYDTGFVALPAKENMIVSVVPPVWTSASRLNPIAPQIEPDAVYYKESIFALAAKHGDVLNKDVVLETIAIRTLRGVVQDAKGRPAAHVMLAVYAGYAPASQWLEDLTPFTPPALTRQPLIPCQTIELNQPAVLLARVQSDDQGRWEVRVLSENERFDWLIGTDKMGLDKLTVAAADATLEHTALSRLEADGGANAPIEVNLVVEPIPGDLLIHVNVTDEAGTPLPGVTWLLNGINGPFVSDKDGRVALPRIARRAELKLADANYQVLSATASGDIVRPPRPKSDPEPRNNTDFDGLEFSISGPGIETTAPYLKTGDQSVAFSVFDTTKGKLVISLKRVVENTAER